MFRKTLTILSLIGLLLSWFSLGTIGEQRSVNSAQSDPKEQHEGSRIDARGDLVLSWVVRPPACYLK